MRRTLPKDAAYKAAYLASIGRSQKEIAGRLGVSAATANRLLERAVESGVLKPLNPVLKLPPNELRKIKNDLFGRDDLLQKLSALSNGTLQHLEVLESGAGRPSAVAVAAAQYVLDDIVRAAKFIAVTWGATNRELVRCIEHAAHGREMNLKHTVHFVQVCGDPQLAISDPTLRCSTLVAKLNTAINGTETSPYTFSISASIPGRFTAEQVTIIRDFTHEVGGYSKIFVRTPQGLPQLAVKIDCLLTSCGNGRSGQDRWLSECAAIAGLPDRRLEELNGGNIGGYWLAKEGLSKADSRTLEDVNSRWIGIGVDDIKAIAQRGGVILLAAEPYKADTIYRLVRRQLVSHLFISSALERALLPLFPSVVRQ